MQEIKRFYPKKQTQYLTHSFHPYPHKLLPQLARALIQEYSNENDIILDPFCGSGTTLVEASLLNRNSIGIDLNPLACLISKVKTTKINIPQLKETTHKLLEKLFLNLNQENNLNDFINKLTPEIPNFPKRDKWFQKEALIGLSILKELINKIENKNIKDFCLVAFSSIIKDVSNASSLYRLTLAKKPKNISQLNVHHQFKKKIEEMILEINDYNLKTNTSSIQIHNRDSRHLWDLTQVDFILTNPPSFSLDFSRCFRIYFWWLELGNLKNLDRILIGTKKLNGKIEKLNIDFTDNLINKIKEERNGQGIALSKYYYDLKQVLAQTHRLLKENKYCCVMVSDCVLEGYSIKAPETFIALAQQVGFTLEKRINRIVPKKALIFAKEDKVEEILVFRKI